ncbi:MAG: serine hydrolase domain-containing protein [Candidatus Cryptobacteroides sp.]
MKKSFLSYSKLWLWGMVAVMGLAGCSSSRIIKDSAWSEVGPQGRRSPIRLERCEAEVFGMNGAILQKCDSVLKQDVLIDKSVPGAVVCVVKEDKIIYENACGYQQLIPEEIPMGTQSVFDLASLSKCFGTTIAVMQLVEQGKIKLDDPVDKYLKGYRNWHKENGQEVKIRIRHLLTHTGGLASYVNVDSLTAVWGEGQADSLKNYIIKDLPRRSEPGKERNYSCPSFVSLQYVVEEVSGQRLCDYVQQNVFDPLGLKQTCYLPLGEEIPQNLEVKIVPSEVLIPGKTASNQIRPDTRAGEILLGEVHDPLARRFNSGNSGNAGIFSDAEGLAVICAALMNGGELNGRRILKKKTVKQMFKVQDKKIGRALGWDSTSPYAWFIPKEFKKDRCVCHSGYTGTSVVMNLDRKTAIILLTNSAHPFDEGSATSLRKGVSKVVAESFGF